MHLVPADRAGHAVIDAARVCDAIAALGEPGDVAARAERFALLGDPGRLALLLCIRRAGPISVTDLALATGMHDSTVSQALRLLRAAGAVTAQRDGRVIRYELSDPAIEPLLALAAPAAQASAGQASAVQASAVQASAVQASNAQAGAAHGSAAHGSAAHGSAVHRSAVHGSAVEGSRA